MPASSETRRYLELRLDTDPVPGRTPASELTFQRNWDPAVCHRLYRDVGEHYHWVDRAQWTDGQWLHHVSAPEIEFWLANAGDQAKAGDQVVGYFELRRDTERWSIEIAYFGLLPDAIGQGFGAAVLGAAVNHARAWGASRVWLHTSSRDHAHALRNCEARGFRVFRTEHL